MANLRVATTDAEHFYRVGALGLRALQDRGFGAERFGANAAARWKAFSGELTDSHRLELLLRDGAAMYPLAFAARSVFALSGLADDEPFGPQWVSLAPIQAGAILREAEGVTHGASVSARELLRAVADAWSLKVVEPEALLLASIKAASRVVVAGAGAVVAIATHMSERNDCDFGDQILLVSEQPGVRQLAGIAAAITGSRKTVRCVQANAAAADAVALGFDRATTELVSLDAATAEATAARSLARELGA